MPTSRLEAFSDGVMAIVLTVMVLELPRPTGHEWSGLHRVWPVLLAYVLSFVYVGIYWTNHHHMFVAVERVTGGALWANLHLLFWLSLFPYVTGWAGESSFQGAAMFSYAVVAFMGAVAWGILIGVLSRDPANRAFVAATGSNLKVTGSIAAYTVAVIAPAFGQIGGIVSAVVLAAVAAVWVIPDRRVERLVGSSTTGAGEP